MSQHQIVCVGSTTLGPLANWFSVWGHLGSPLELPGFAGWGFTSVLVELGVPVVLGFPTCRACG